MLFELVLGIVLTIATAMLIVSEVYDEWKTNKTYANDREASLLIGRYTEGIDHKGRRTGKIIEWKEVIENG